MPTSVLRGALAAAVALLTFATPAAADAAAERVPALVLSEPTGPHPVGTTSLHLIDESRPDPWVAEKTARELMVSLWYPARTAQGRRAPYTTAREAELLLKELLIKDLPADALSRARTNAFTDAPALGHDRGLPLVVLSPGFSAPRSSLTTLAEDLASKGYVVAGIDHTYESAGTAFPDGRITTCVACRSLDSPGFGKKATRGRAADVSFVLDQLLGPDPAWKGARLIDPSRIAMAGHSLGGASSAWTMLTDARVRAGINLDGGFHIPIPSKGLSRPFLLLGAVKSHKPGGQDPSWGRDWRRMTGWKRWLTVDGMDHPSFSDFPLIADRIGGGRLPGSRAVEITRTYVGAFVDLHLRKRPQPLLEGPSRRYPEVEFWNDSRRSGTVLETA
ncbi:alpha/beta hydrolase [Planomonospora sp. ID91781]|uniref:alpha/beta hydrolase family protein n=1 Tax=Planomonospora sp. ID91781 TaxID=2738135 RepID=UPI0018C3FA7A|nr:alpha/beta hydrolase [Planomonospora sp. ID91781]MBG0825659.1 alpha/beta hydrolase [Planomonospora sp. ID91781]